VFGNTKHNLPGGEPPWTPEKAYEQLTMNEQNRRDSKIRSLRITHEEDAILIREAHTAGLSVNAFVKIQIANYISREINPHEYHALNMMQAELVIMREALLSFCGVSWDKATTHAINSTAFSIVHPKIYPTPDLKELNKTLHEITSHGNKINQLAKLLNQKETITDYQIIFRTKTHLTLLRNTLLDIFDIKMVKTISSI